MGFIAFSLGSIDIYWYGICVVVAILVGLFIIKLNTKLYHESFEPIIDMTVWGLPCSIVMARIFYVLLNWNNYSNHIAQIFCIWQGGLSIYGALLGLLGSACIYLKYHKMDIWYWLNIITPAVVFGLMVLQIANFTLQISVGTPLSPDLPNDHRLAEYIEYKYRPSGFEGYLYFRPIALYQAVALFVIFVLTAVMSIVGRFCKSLANGSIFLVAVFLISAARFALGFDYLSMNKDELLYPAQWVALLGMGVAVIVYLLKRFFYRKQR